MNSLYIHIPFCQRKCFYCSFAVVVGQEARIDRYLDVIESEARGYQGEAVDTIYIGGGTPSRLSVEQIKRLLNIVRVQFDLRNVREWSFEVNPEDFTAMKLGVCREGGVTRISMGVQSFSDQHLTYLGRCHDVNTARQTLNVLQEGGIANINCDLMFGFGEQNVMDVERDLDQCRELGCSHISLYALNIEPRSRFYARSLAEWPDEKCARWYEDAVERLCRAGYEQYEVSNFSRPGFESQHNVNYWEGGDYIGLGMSAHSHRNGHRFWNADRLRDYFQLMNEKGRAVVGEEWLDPEKRLCETLLLGLRMNRGVDIPALEKTFGCRLTADRYDRLHGYAREGWLECEGGHWWATDKGRLVLDEISSYIV